MTTPAELAARLIAEGAKAADAKPVQYLVGQGLTKSQAISATILALVAEGIEFRVAFDAVLGAGRFQALSDAVWHELREKAGR